MQHPKLLHHSLLSGEEKHNTPHSTVIFREFFENISLKSCNIARICKNAVRKVSRILQKPCNVRSKHYKCNVAAKLIFHFNIAVM